MRTNIFTALLVVGYAVSLTSPAMADEDDDASATSRTVMVDEDCFSSGGSVELDKRVDGDAFLSGGRVALRAPVRGDVVLAGGDVNVTDTVGQDLYAAGGSIAISSQVAGNARIAGGQVTISQRGGIAGKATVAAGTLSMAGRIGRYLVVYGDSVRIDGEVGGDLRITARSVKIGPEAKIHGRLTYRSPQPAQIDPAAIIAGGVTQQQLDWPKEQVSSIARVATWVSIVLLTLSLMVVGAMMIIAFPNFSAGAADTVRSDPWKSLGLGFSLLLCIPVAAILFMVTVVGIPLGVAVLFFYPAMLLLGYLTGALFLGDRAATWVASRRGVTARVGGRFAALSAALLLLLLASRIPIAGYVVLFLILLFGLGAFWIRAYRGYVKKPPPENGSQLGLDFA